jgi:hypothetical protein
MKVYAGWCVDGPYHGTKKSSPRRTFYIEGTHGRSFAVTEAIRRIGHYYWYELTHEWIWVPGMK